MSSVREKILTGSVAFLLGFVIFARAGTYTPWQKPFVWLSVLVFSLLVLLPKPLDHANNYLKTYLLNLKTIVTDPMFYLSVMFLTLLVLQWANSGRVRIFNFESMQWGYTPAPRPGWPSAITRHEATEMLNWFAPAFALLMTLRHGLTRKTSRYHILHILLGIATVSAIFGAIQIFTGTSRMYWFMDIGAYFFSTFGYPNHAATFYVLTLALALAFCLRELARPFSSWRRWNIFVYLLSALILLAGAHLSLSRTGILLSTVLILVAIAYFVASSWHEFSLSLRINLVVCCMAIVGIGFFLLAASGAQGYQNELSTLINSSPDQFMDKRWFMIKAAWSIWKDAPWFGVGGWGFRYLIGIHLPPEEQELVGIGKANVHNDPMQFLAEFGLVGFGLLTLLTVWLLIPPLRLLQHKSHPWPPPFLLFTLIGLGSTLLHAQFDLPFRCPAVIYTWITIAVCCAPAIRNTPLQDKAFAIKNKNGHV